MHSLVFERSGAPFGTNWILEGVPQSHFSAKDQHIMKRSEVPEGVSNYLLFRNQREKVTFQEASFSLDFHIDFPA